jgi:uncharacterized protein YidB (DUF937 family)
MIMNMMDTITNLLGDKANLSSLGELMGNGGLESIVSQLNSGGLSEVVSSWVGNGENLPVNPEQLSQALSPEMLQSLSGLMGADVQSLAQKLPELINSLTPNGQIEQLDLGSLLSGGTGQGGLGAIGDLIGSFLKR